MYRSGENISTTLSGKDRSPAKDGELNVILTIPNMSGNMTGYMYEITRNFFGITDGIKRWCMLYDKKFYICDGPWGTESKFTRSVAVDCNDILHVNTEEYMWTEIAFDSMRLNYELTSDLFAWTEDDPRKKEQWVDAFIYSTKKHEDIEVNAERE